MRFIMREARTFIQFIHPGLEHGSDRGSAIRSWNTGMHRRKFLTTAGRIHADGAERESRLLFWGEWEAPTRVIARFPRSSNGCPRFLHEPLPVAVPSQTDGLQNTDPFVFGDRFLYTCCQQFTRNGPTQLRYLAPGSIILFGSYLRGRFLLDTLFVTRSSLDHEPTDDPEVAEEATSPTYRLATIERIYASDAGRPVDYRLYFGATPSDQVDGMFSSFPCAPYGEGQSFARPEIRIDGYVNPALRQGYKIYRRDLTAHDLRGLWERVASQVRDAGLQLGVFAALPRVGDGP